ncbi:hypothetical protein RFI_22554, partial [Reticulomyxa filosa]
MKPTNQTKKKKKMYGEIFGITYTNPSLLARLYFDPHFTNIERLVNLLTNGILPNHYDRMQEHIMVRIIEDVMKYEYNQCEDITTYLRENTTATKLLQAYLKRQHISDFIDNTVKECGEFCLKNPEEDLEIDPEAVWEGMLIQVEEAADIKDPNDPKIQNLCAQRREKLREFVKYIISRITNADNYPMGLRILCKKLIELAHSKVYEQDNEKIAESLVGGFIFLRIFNPRIQLYGHEQTKVHKQHAKQIRRRFTLIAKILQNISNQMIGGVKEAFMASLNDLIVEEISKVKKFFKELCNVLPLEHHFAMDRKIREKSPRDDLVYLSLSDLSFLKKMLWNDYSNNAKKSDDLMEKEYYTLIKNVCEKDPFSMSPSSSSALNSDASSKGDKGNLSNAAGGSGALGNGVNGNLTGDTTGSGVHGNNSGNNGNDMDKKNNDSFGGGVGLGGGIVSDDDDEQEPEEHNDTNVSGNSSTKNNESLYRYVKISVHEYMQQREKTDAKSN